jgi:uncharacterized DUF497 family protein
VGVVETETYILEGQVFEWDRHKNLANVQKHGITFKVAVRAFFDPMAERFADDFHSHDENRFIVIGMDEIDRVLTVCHCLRGENESIIRIISARKATAYEHELYEGGL